MLVEEIGVRMCNQCHFARTCPDCPVDNLASVSESPDYFYALVVG